MSSSSVKEDNGEKKIFHYKKESLQLSCEWNCCNEAFPTMQLFLEHLQFHMERQPFEELTCMWRECGHILSTAHEFIIHTNYHAFHTKLKCLGTNLLRRKNMKECTLSSTSRNIIPELPEKLVCSWMNCEISFNCPERFYQHVDEHVESAEKTVCCWEACNVSASNGYKLRDHLRSHTQEKQIACPTCGGLFSNRTKLIDHVKRQVPVEEQLYQCSHCSKRLASERLLRDHIRNHINHYKCPYCEMTCCSPSNLNNHLKYRHANERPHSCNYCEYSGKTQGDLCRHLETHLSQPQHKCDVENCSYVTRSFHSLKSHITKEHQKGAVSTYLCHLCKKEFTRGTYLTRHLIKIHAFRWPAGHCRFRYKRGEGGYYELQTIRYESIEISPDDQSNEDTQDVGIDDLIMEKNENDLSVTVNS